MGLDWEQIKKTTTPKSREEKYMERMQIYANMKMRRITMGKVAEKLGVTKQWVSQYFNGKIDFTPKMEEELFEYLKEEFKK